MHANLAVRWAFSAHSSYLANGLPCERNPTDSFLNRLKLKVVPTGQLLWIP